MGFDLRKTISKFSSRLQKQQKGNNEVLTPTTTTTREDESQRPGSAAAAKRKVKVPISTFTTSTASHDSNTNSTNNVTSQTIRKNGKAVKVVKFVDCDCSRNIKVSPYCSVPQSETGTTTKSVSFSISTPHPSDGRRQLPFERSLSSISSKEDFPAAAPKSPNSSLGCAANEKPAQIRNMLPATEGIHSRNLSYGTIFNASKSASSRELRPCPKDARSNAKATTADVGNVSQRVSAKPGRSVPHVFGLGGCSYGHGSIVNGMKSLKNPTTVDFEFSQRKGDVAKRKQGSQPALSYHSSSSSQAYSVDELKNMGNEEYSKGQFKNAIYFYDKAIGLMPCNAACHHNKAAALASLGRIREAVVECLEAVSCDPAYSRAHYRLGTLYTKLGHLDNAKKHLRMSGSGHSSEAVQRMLAVEGHMNSMKRALKILDWERVIIESSKSLKAGAVECDEAFAAKAEALLHLHRPNEALEILKARKSTGDGNSGRTFSHFLRLGTQVYLCLGRFEEAVKVAEEALNAEYNTDSLLLLKKAWAAADAHRAGNEYYEAGKFSEASAMYGRGLEHIPANTFLIYKRATSRIRMGQWERAVDDLNAVLKINPGHYEALQQRAQAFAKLGRCHGKMLREITRF